jgi:hypothetical protein
MKNLKNFGIALVAVMFLVSCSAPSEKSVTADDVEISGNANKYLKVVDGDYMFTNDGDDASISVKFELKSKPEGKICKDYMYGGLRINATGANGRIFDTGTYGFKADGDELTKLIDLINNGEVGDAKTFSFTWNYYGVSKDKGEPIFKEATSFEVIDDRSIILCSEKKEKEKEKVEEEKKSSSSSSSSNYSDNEDNKKERYSSSTGTENWDKVLDSYENYIDQYIKLLKKAENEDMDAMSEYAEMMEKATDLTEKLENADDELTTSQMSRFVKLQTKLATAASEL